MLKANAAAKTFSALLERSGEGLNWTIVRVPVDVARVWGKRGQLRVKGEINGFAFRTSLFPTGQGSHILMVNKKMQSGGRTTPGMTAKFRVEPDTEPRVIAMPAELTRALRQSKALQKYYESFNYSTRHEIAKWIGAGKQSGTRARRAERMAERLMLTMDAEREPPPVLQAAFRGNPKALAGWELMPRLHRRHHLLAIFYYRNPESRARRVAKAMAEMVTYAEKREQRSRRGDE